MLGLKKQYKQPPSTFGNTRKIKSDLIQEQQERRKKRRTKDFEEKRKENSHFSTISQKSKLIRDNTSITQLFLSIYC